MKNKVAIVKCDDYNQKNVDSAVREALNLIGGAGKFIKKNNKVLLKVNLLMPSQPENGITTHPAVIKTLGKIVIENGGIPYIGDSSMWQTNKALDVCGVTKVCEELSCKAVNLESYPPKEISDSQAKILKKMYVSSLVKDVDVLVTVPKLKVHEMMLFTGAVKNMFGIIPGRNKTLMHKKAPNTTEFSELLIDLYSNVTPTFALMDGIINVEGSAGVGSTRKIGVILASENPISLDVVASSIIGYAPETLPLNNAAKRRGFSGTNLDEIEIVGEKLKNVKVVEFKKPPSVIPRMLSTPWLNKLNIIINFISTDSKPVVEKKKCIRCKMCENKCPVKAVKVDKYPIFDYNLCIRCFCCSEGCQVGAVKEKASMINQIVIKVMDMMTLK